MSDPTGLADKVRCGYAAEGAALGLLGLMTGLSEELICAGWVGELEYTLWMAEAGTHIGIGAITEQQALLLRLLSEEAQGWWMWSDELGGPAFVSLEAWRSHIATSPLARQRG